MALPKPVLHLVQLAGGRGLRAGAGLPKQFRDLGQGPLFGHSLRSFLTLGPQVGTVASVTVTVSEQWAPLVRETLAPMVPESVAVYLAESGETRTASTWSALQVLIRKGRPEADDLVAVHDAARPLATVRLLEALTLAAGLTGAAVPGIPVTDTILQTSPEGAETRYLQRDQLVAVQTPQVFRWGLLYPAHEWAARQGRTFTDDGSLVASRGTSPVVVPGEQTNWKVTTEGDIHRLENLLGE